MARFKVQNEPFVIPSQVQSLNTKIRNIFFRQANTTQNSGELVTPDFEFENHPTSPYKPVPLGRSGSMTARKSKTVNQFKHYDDHEYSKSLQTEVT